MQDPVMCGLPLRQSPGLAGKLISNFTLPTLEIVRLLTISQGTFTPRELHAIGHREEAAVVLQQTGQERGYASIVVTRPQLPFHTESIVVSLGTLEVRLTPRNEPVATWLGSKNLILNDMGSGPATRIPDHQLREVLRLHLEQRGFARLCAENCNQGICVRTKQHCPYDALQLPQCIAIRRQMHDRFSSEHEDVK